jgi:integrase
LRVNWAEVVLTICTAKFGKSRLVPLHPTTKDVLSDYALQRIQRFERQGLPIISVDTKKRELVGNFKNNGVKWDRTPVRVNDHDFRSDAIGVAIPYGIYDLLANRGSVFVGVSHDTAAFAAHSIADWWKRDGADRYHRRQQLLILADTGGRNSCRTGAWKTELQSQLCNSFGLTVTVAHYPTGASKWNPIEPPVLRNLQKLGRRAS